MKFTIALTVVFILAFGMTQARADAANPHEGELQKHWDILDDYCIDCHNFVDNAGGFSFEPLFPNSIASEAPLWEAVIRKLDVGMMPPPGEKRPSNARLKAFADALENALDFEAETNPNPGTVVLHRLNRTEYANAVRDILGLEVDPARLLPQDDESHGFTNNAGVLKVSPTFLEQSILAAREVSTLALGDPQASPKESVYRGPPNSSQYVHIDGLPLGTRGGMIVEHHFPADGDYEFSIHGLVGAVYVWGVLDRNTLIITVDGKKVFEESLGGPEDLRAVDLEQASAVSRINGRFQNVRIPVTAGAHRIGVTFLAKTAAESHETLHSFVPVTGMSVPIQGNSYGPRIDRLVIKGPIKPEGLSPTPSREKIFSCYPQVEKQQIPCARQILAELARQAFRRTATSEELDALLGFYRQGHTAGGFEAGIQKGLMAILSNPKFLYRATTPKDSNAPSRGISDLALASRLSFFLWSSPPDQELLALAEAGRLSEPAILEQQVRRLLEDDRTESLVTSFAFQWLNVQGLRQVEPDPTIYPQFTPDLSGDFATELQLFISSIFREDRSVTELLSAPHTFVNERLALHYGLKNVRGGRFRRVEWNDPQRFGLLGKGAVLMTTSYSNRTSPVVRGAYILEKLIGVAPPSPPPDVEAFPENAAGATPATVRERLEMHREQPSCNACHAIIDPPGLALENYNAIGQWRDRDRDAGTAIDASGQLVDGTTLRNPEDLRQALLTNPERFVQTFTERLMAFALGRGIEHYDMPTVRKIVRESKRDDFRFSALVMGVVNSPAFQMDSTMDVTATKH